MESVTRCGIPEQTSDVASHSIGFVTMHKAGSVFVDQVLSKLTHSAGFDHVDLARQAFHTGALEHLYCVARAHELSRLGCYFGPFRGSYVRKMPGIERLRLVVQVRDPRDCIVSFYYSVKHSHPPPAPGPAQVNYERIRAVTQSADLDLFARRRARDYAVRMQVLRRMLQSTQDRIVLRYEDMVSDPLKWLSSLCEFLRVDLSPHVADWVSAETCADGLVEDVSRHRRQVRPGDFRRKLSPTMQGHLTRVLQPHLDAFGYH
jgi:hypothetical protein